MTKTIIKCECGAEILFNTDLPSMRKAIEAHADTHRQVERDCSKTAAANEGEAALEVSRIRDYLMKKVMEMDKYR